MTAHCGASPRCRQPLTLFADILGHRIPVCEKHAGRLLTSHLSARGVKETATVRLRWRPWTPSAEEHTWGEPETQGRFIGRVYCIDCGEVKR